MEAYKSVWCYFQNYFKDTDLCILSTHSYGNCINEIRKMIELLKGRYYNVESMVFLNHLNISMEKISKLNWDKRNFIDNPIN